MPTGTKLVTVAVMKTMTGEGIIYKTIAVSQVRYVPPAGYPVVDLQAATSTGTPIGGWAGRRLTSAAETKQQIEARELKEREAREKVEREAREAAEREAREREAREHVNSRMRVGLDAGGWDWASAVKDVGGAVRYVRASYGYYNSDSQMQLLASNSVTLMPLFTGGSSIGSINRSTFAGNVVNWFKRYGHGGTFWAGKTDLGATTAEILNEPGNPYFWSDPGNYGAYAALATSVHDALQALPAPDRPALLLSYDGGYGGDSYGRALVKADPAITMIVGGWTVHPNGGHGSSSAQANRPRVTEAYADTHQPVYVTEVGWPTATGKEATGDSLQWSESQQAANIKGFVLWARSLGYVDAVIDFNYADYGRNNWYGVVDTSGTKHKLAYATLRGLTAEG
ncbi:MAG: hypothetical protein H0X28_09615 [Solirubrobacterales bacterium]|nr:hypothetical protein [Solirubrobacterales bacterium]